MKKVSVVSLTVLFAVLSLICFITTQGTFLDYHTYIGLMDGALTMMVFSSLLFVASFGRDDFVVILALGLASSSVILASLAAIVAFPVVTPAVFITAVGAAAVAIATTRFIFVANEKEYNVSCVKKCAVSYVLFYLLAAIIVL